MKRLLLIISPYLIFCSLFSLPFIFRPSKIKEKIGEIKNDTTKVVTTTDTTMTQEIIDSLENVDSALYE